MKSHPILFSAPMVTALLDGTKTQTRRAIKKQPEWFEPDASWQHGNGHSGIGWYVHSADYPDEGADFYRCPHGQVGDRLWVRETYWRDEEDGSFLYAADPQDREIVDQNKHETGLARFNWKPSIFMPHAASRITLEVTNVRVERLQDIGALDALAEGVSMHDHFKGRHDKYGPVAAYKDLWETINGDDSWDLNPWVWVIEFKRVQP